MIGDYTVIPIFDAGGIYITPGAADMFDRREILDCLYRHVSGDWGDVPPEDAAANNAALADGTRLVSAYNLPEGTVWIITEADRSATTILLPEDY